MSLRLMRRRVWQRALWGFGLGALILWSAHVGKSDITLLFGQEGWQNASEVLAGFMRPDLSRDFLQRVLRLSAESLAIGVLGMLLAVFIAVPLAILSARYPNLIDPPGNFLRWRLTTAFMRWLARMTLAIMRSVPEIIWAFLFVRILGLGPGPAVLAIGLTFGGVTGKLYADLLEACAPGPVRVLRAAGNRSFAVLLYGLLPQVRNQWIGYALFRFECAVRSASVLGIVGAGGIGAEIDLSSRYFQYDKLATALLAVLACILAIEAVSIVLRRIASRWTGVVAAAGALYGFASLDVRWMDVFSWQALDQAKQFIAGFLSPTTERAFLASSTGLMLETLGIALWGTFLAAMLALFMAPLATRMLTVRGFLVEAPKGRGLAPLLAWAVFLGARFSLQVLRALPELVFAVIFVVWVGPGPFAGVLAITAHTTGILGRLFGEVYEEVEPDPPRVLERSGTGTIGRWAYGVLPQVGARLAAFTLYRFEVNVRATAMMGFVGAGGIGNAIHSAISLFHMSDLPTLLLVLLATVSIVDMVNGVIRRRFLIADNAATPSRPPPLAAELDG